MAGVPERLHHVLAHLAATHTQTRAHRRDQVVRLAAVLTRHRTDGFDSRRLHCPSPPGMRRADCSAMCVGKENGSTVGDAHGNGCFGVVADNHVRLRRRPRRIIMQCGNRDCVPLVGGAVIPKDKQRRTARIPDATVRCGEKSVAMFEIVSPTDGITTELRAKRRRDIKSVDGAQVLVEIEQDAPVIHIHRRVGDFWVYDDVIGVLEAIAMEIPLSERYDRLFEGSEPVEDELDVGSADGAS